MQTVGHTKDTGLLQTQRGFRSCHTRTPHTTVPCQRDETHRLRQSRRHMSSVA